MTDDSESAKVDPNIPQDTERIERICLAARATKDCADATPAAATAVYIAICANDPRLWETAHDGGCLVYTLFYAIHRNSFLRALFHSGARRTPDAYFFYTRVCGAMHTIAVPVSVVAEEKAANRARIFSTDLEFLNAVTLLCFAVMFLKYGFIDRLALQPFIDTDMFFDRPFAYLGTGATIEAAAPGAFALRTDQRAVALLGDGAVAADAGPPRAGHFVFTLAYYAEGCNFGHCVVVFWDCDEQLWRYYNNLNDENVERIGEFPLAAVVPCSLNGLVIMSGVATAD
jgi:hypothetical protein